MAASDALRQHLLRLLDWEDAHVGFDRAVDGIPAEQRGACPAGFDRTPWQLVEHLRIAQEDILAFCLDPDYAHDLRWPDDYWPTQPAPPDADAWTTSLAAFRASRARLAQLVGEIDDLAATVPAGKGNQTYLRAILLAADHASYHVGQLVSLRRALGAWVDGASS